jgi:hypothetical protein
VFDKELVEKNIHHHLLLLLGLCLTKSSFAKRLSTVMRRSEATLVTFFLVQTRFLSAFVPLPYRSRLASPKSLVAAPSPFVLRATLNETVETSFPEKETYDSIDISPERRGRFDLSAALFCAGMAFDAYSEPPQNSSRWERGSQGLQVCFCSSAYTRNLYKGLVEVQVQKILALPEEEQGGVERLLSGSGVDACLLVAVLEGSWKEDIDMLEREQYHSGVLDLSGAAHVGRSSTCWSSVDEKKAKASEAKSGKALPYHVAGWIGRPAQAVWPASEPPFYLYVQDPATARLVFTVLDDERIGEGSAVGSTHKKLTELIPRASLSHNQLMDVLKREAIKKVKAAGSMDVIDEFTMQQLDSAVWQGVLPLTSKPRKRDKGGQRLAGAVAGALVAGPAGAAAGAVLGSVWEGQVQGKIQAKLRYRPIPQVPVERKTYQVLGGLPGVNWGSLFNMHFYQQQQLGLEGKGDSPLENNDLEHCFFVNHEKTGATCAVYRSLEKKTIVVSFRGTCTPIDLITDANLLQDAWVEGEDVKNQTISKVHAGFRTSLQSIQRRLKELLLATPAPGEDLSDYRMFVTGHSLGGALATLFTADIGEYGIDAGRGLPQMEASEPWWKGIVNTFMGEKAEEERTKKPPRPKSLRLYNFGSPRVGNRAFAKRFDGLVKDGLIDEAYRIVNGDDIVARLPRTMNALILGQVDYEHVGTTALVTQPQNKTDTEEEKDSEPRPLLWVEGESDDSQCPVRDFVEIPMASPLAEGSLLGDLLNATRAPLTDQESEESWTSKLSAAVNKMGDRMKRATASDLATLVGIQQKFTDREIRIIRSLIRGQGLAHHMEDEYYSGMGRASGFLARVGEQIVELNEDIIEV